MANEGGTIVSLGQIDRNYYKKLRKEINLRKIGGIERWLRLMVTAGGWRGEYHEFVVNEILRIIVEYNIQIKFPEFKSTVQSRLDGNLEWFQKLLKSDSIEDCYTYIESILSKIFPDDWSVLFKKMWKIVFLMDRAAVGPGEVFFTLFSNAVKGKTGDLFIDGLGEIELKSNGGRLGTSNYTHQAPERLSNILSTGYNHNLAAGSIIHGIHKDIKAVEKRVADRINKIISYITKSKKLKGDVRELLLITIPHNTNFTFLDSVSKLLDHGSQTKVIDSLKEDLTNLKFKLQHLLEVTTNSTEYAGEKMNWGSSVKNFFQIDWGMNNRSLAAGFIELRTELMEPEQIESFRQSIFRKLYDDTVQKLYAKDKKTISNFILAVQLVSYYSEMKFDYLTVINTDNFNMFTFNFKHEKGVASHFESVYDKVSTNKNFDCNMSVDKANKGVQLILK